MQIEARCDLGINAGVLLAASRDCETLAGGVGPLQDVPDSRSANACLDLHL